jgi:hypothetical protein
MVFGEVAKGLCDGLQSRSDRFDSCPRLILLVAQCWPASAGLFFVDDLLIGLGNESKER